jgi:hypothetical protein
MYKLAVQRMLHLHLIPLLPLLSKRKRKNVSIKTISNPKLGEEPAPQHQISKKSKTIMSNIKVIQ